MNKIIILIFLLLGILFLTVFKSDSKLQVNFLDVGQGDAILIRTPEGQNILIDGGPDNKLLSEIAKVLPWWEREIDYVVISHYHADHIVGLIELLDKYKVKNILTTAHQPDDFLYKAWEDKLSEKNIKESIIKAGERFVIDNNLSWQILLADSEHEDYNDNSLIIRLSYGDQDWLFMGDLGVEGEKEILGSGLDIASEYLKVGHHGSRYSSSEEFLEAVSPEKCIIQSGKDNKFGHPHQEAIDRLKSIGCQIMDTQDLGLISFSF